MPGKIEEVKAILGELRSMRSEMQADLTTFTKEAGAVHKLLTDLLERMREMEGRLSSLEDRVERRAKSA